MMFAQVCGNSQQLAQRLVVEIYHRGSVVTRVRSAVTDQKGAIADTESPDAATDLHQ